MKSLRIIALALIFITAFSCKQAKKEAEKTTEEVEETVEQIVETMEPQVITFTMEPKSDSNVNGEVMFTEEDNEVIMRATFTGLDEGEHAIHLHEKADCSSADGKSTGGHWNPTFEQHGKWGSEDGYHKGDIGNFSTDSNGNAIVDFSTDEWCIGCDDDTKNILGKAVIVHQGVDDYTSQPSGAAGARIACTGIIQ
ncbi:superoxide dismutase family protein [Allomuricauda sp. F6463D]|uniref:superoxide dismutase family protein n=1 Tax=Allomuricauda sp. F6463D TaxID=2926409 RepID=UPI001FF5CB31|nr:superoxide dismutase family protein [Muricauda sp. F6463D]MCK0159934.1 superoxide dismutase family protein [Muricauda sp. F6463D]